MLYFNTPLIYNWCTVAHLYMCVYIHSPYLSLVCALYIAYMTNTKVTYSWAVLDVSSQVQYGLVAGGEHQRVNPQ